MSSNSPPVLGEPLPLELVNTQFFVRGKRQDGLESVDEFSAWLSRVAGRLPLSLSGEDMASVSEGDLALARSLREALRTLLTGAIEDDRRDADAVDALNRVIRSAPYWQELSMDPGRTVFASDGPRIVATMAAIAEESVTLLNGPDAAMLRACPAPDCTLLFQKNHSRRKWCSARCSNRDRAARHYARHSKR